MKDISLCIMTRELCHEFYKGFENDPAIFMDTSTLLPYEYSEQKVNEYFDARQQDSSRILFAVMKGEKPIGELQLKNIDDHEKECSLSIHLQNDTVKGKGYGTCAERLALQYAFDVLGVRAVNADTVTKNTRSQHILEKIGFQFVREENDFKYYRYIR
ncbi:MAG: GNAT family N-acetyltransferase [Lachnospiraceae bacterium]|nr:GNAT family N-acetyltransferase [Lachnospiraceae bacterium]